MVRYHLDLAGGDCGAIGGVQMSETIIPFGAKTIGASTYRGRKAQTLLQAARHNFRDIQKELGANSHIDAGRIGLNEIMAGPATPAGVAALALELMAGAGENVTKLRKDYTQAHELLYTLAADTSINPHDYFGRCLAWTGEQFGHDNIVSAVVHMDESAPHLHVLIVPVQDGRYLGTSLIDRARLKKLRAMFASDVAPAFGLKVMPPLAGAMRAKVILMIYERLESTLDPVLQSALWLTVKADIARNPAPYMARLGIVPEHDTPVNDGGKAFKRIALSTGKGGKTERPAKPYGFETGVSDGVQKPYGFESDPENHRNPSCVGFAPKAPPQPASKAPPEQCIEDVDQPLTDTPNADGEVAPPARHDPHDVDGVTLHDTHDGDQSTSNAQQVSASDDSNLNDVQFIELTTRHRDHDQPNEITARTEVHDRPALLAKTHPGTVTALKVGPTKRKWVVPAYGHGTYRRLTAKPIGLFTSLFN